ncbi:MAG: PBP1A family penicillin-binding protein [Firmicutes bacterium]|nr:PBP1A family penicillin-binding protein [Bacillota bacterium]
MADMRSDTRGFIHIVTLALILLVLVGLGMAAGIMAGYLKNAPSVEDVDVEARRVLPTVVYDVNGNVLTKLKIEDRQWVRLADIPQHLIDAVIAVEDHRFYEHHGISVRRILGALWYDIRHLSDDQGGSTITAQLARNVFLSHEKTISRKIWEALYAFQLERRYTKDEILEFYLNWVYFGHGTYGVQAASNLFFGKPVDQLTLGEVALLAGIPRGNELYSPIKNEQTRQNGLNRRKIVLNRMVDVGYITSEQAAEAASEPLRLASRDGKAAPMGKYVNFMVRDYLLQRYGKDAVYRGGLSVRTSIDQNAQRAAEEAVSRLLPTGSTPESRKDNSNLTYPQVALVAIDAQTGQIRALVGGRGEDEYNRALRAQRSPGSSIKPFVYTAAIDSGYTTATVIVDEPVEYPAGDGKTWAPKNFNGKFLGPLRLRQALEQSTNIIAVKLTQDLGPAKVISYARKMGITTLVDTGPKNDRGLALALGGLTRGVTPIEMVEAYSSLANAGVKVTPYFILEVRDADGVLLESNVPQREMVLDERTAYIVADMMRGVIYSPNGTGKRADIGRPAAGKTGTADSNTDAWFVGFTPDVVAAVWIGEDTNREMRYPDVGVIGSGKAAEIWGAFMKKALAGVPPRDFAVPEGVLTGVRVCAASGELATPSCPESGIMTEKFIEGAQPTRACSVHSVSGWWGNGVAPPDEP